MVVVFTKVLEIFAILGVGFFANRRGILPAESNKYLVNLLLLISTPCLIFTSIASKELTSKTFAETIHVIIGEALFFLVGAVLAHLLMKLMKVEPLEDRGVLEVVMCSVNTGFMGFPITLMIFGQEAFYYMVICNLVLTLYLYSVAYLQIGSKDGENQKLIDRLKPMVNPSMISAIAGVIVLFGGIKIPDAIMECMELIGDATIPLAMLVVGILFGESNIKETLTNKHLMRATFISMTLWPALTFLAVYFIPMATMPKAMLIFSGAFPSAAVVPALAQQQGKNAKLAAQGVTLTTLVSMITIPIMALILRGVFKI